MVFAARTMFLRWMLASSGSPRLSNALPPRATTRVGLFCMVGSLNAIAFQWATHAACAAASAPQFIARDWQHGDAGFVIFLVGPDVALVTHDDAGAQREDVVGVVPLLTLGFKKASPPVVIRRT